MCQSKSYHELPGTKSSPYRGCSLLFGKMFITRTKKLADGVKPYCTEYGCKVIGPNSIELTKASGEVYRVTLASCSCESRVPCVHMAALRVLTDAGEIKNTEIDDDYPCVDATAEYYEEKDAYYAARFA